MPEQGRQGKRFVDSVQAGSGAKMVLQLAHAGRRGSTRRLWEGIDEPLPDGNWPLISASPLPYFPHSQTPREMDRRDMDGVRDAFARAAGMAVQAGLAPIGLPSAPRYPPASFLFPRA